jgi:hypothetical protein
MSKLKTFEDISWKQHRVGKGAIQGLLPLSGGFELSVVAGVCINIWLPGGKVRIFTCSNGSSN